MQNERPDPGASLRCKSDVSDDGDCELAGDSYQYDAGAHRVTSVATAQGERSYVYDDVGNLLREEVEGDPNRSFKYTSFNKVRRICQGQCGSGLDTDFHYGPDRSRFIKREVSGGVVQSRTHYVGGVEVVFKGSDLSSPRIRRVVAGVAIETIEDTGLSVLRYQHRDHLGSIVALSTASGELHAEMRFDAWGKRRSSDWQVPPWQQGLWPETPDWALLMLEVTPRGFTGHEHLDAHGIINMNGRIYDPHLARFLQADPFIEDTATLNRYAYVHNNPLVLTDPSGYFSFKKWARVVASIAVQVYAGASAQGVGWGLWGSSVSTTQAVATVTAGGALAGGISSGTWEGVSYGAFSALAFYNVGQEIAAAPWARGGFGGTDLSAAGLAAKTVSHGLIGGACRLAGRSIWPRLPVLRDGGFIAVHRRRLWRQPFEHKAMLASIIGGTVSKSMGGKFANGAYRGYGVCV